MTAVRNEEDIRRAHLRIEFFYEGWMWIADAVEDENGPYAVATTKFGPGYCRKVDGTVVPTDAVVERLDDELHSESSCRAYGSTHEAVAEVRAAAARLVAWYGEPVTRRTFVVSDGSMAKMAALVARADRELDVVSCLAFVAHARYCPEFLARLLRRAFWYGARLQGRKERIA